MKKNYFFEAENQYPCEEKRKKSNLCKKKLKFSLQKRKKKKKKKAFT